jgi:uncharacterized protein
VLADSDRPAAPAAWQLTRYDLGEHSDTADLRTIALLQVLTALSSMDTLVVCCAAGLSEELLFRGALIPATAPDWRGVLVAAVVFGALHNNGGRNLAFALWAGGVGALYGGIFLFTQDIWVPVGAHALANMGSALLFWDKYSKARLEES